MFKYLLLSLMLLWGGVQAITLYSPNQMHTMRYGLAIHYGEAALAIQNKGYTSFMADNSDTPKALADRVLASNRGITRQSTVTVRQHPYLSQTLSQIHQADISLPFSEPHLDSMAEVMETQASPLVSLVAPDDADNAANAGDPVLITAPISAPISVPIAVAQGDLASVEGIELNLQLQSQQIPASEAMLSPEMMRLAQKLKQENSLSQETATGVIKPQSFTVEAQSLLGGLENSQSSRGGGALPEEERGLRVPFAPEDLAKISQSNSFRLENSHIMNKLALSQHLPSQNVPNQNVPNQNIPSQESAAPVELSSAEVAIAEVSHC
ncbi:MAG: hypothetical protein R2865_07530 [Deinococcales bacterium]